MFVEWRFCENREEEWSQLGSKWTSEWSPRLSAKTTHHFLEVCQREFQFWKHCIIMGWETLECALTQCKREIVARDFYFLGNSLSGRNYNFLTMLPCTPPRQITPFQFPNVFFLYVPRMIVFYSICLFPAFGPHHSAEGIWPLLWSCSTITCHIDFCANQAKKLIAWVNVFVFEFDWNTFEKGAGNHLHASLPKQKILLFVQRSLEIFWPWFFSSNPGRFWWCEWEEATGSAWSGFLIRLLVSLCWYFLDLVEISNFKQFDCTSTPPELVGYLQFFFVLIFWFELIWLICVGCYLQEKIHFMRTSVFLGMAGGFIHCPSKGHTDRESGTHTGISTDYWMFTVLESCWPDPVSQTTASPNHGIFWRRELRFK